MMMSGLLLLLLLLLRLVVLLISKRLLLMLFERGLLILAKVVAALGVPVVVAVVAAAVVVGLGCRELSVCLRGIHLAVAGRPWCWNRTLRCSVCLNVPCQDAKGRCRASGPIHCRWCSACEDRSGESWVTCRWGERGW